MSRNFSTAAPFLISAAIMAGLPSMITREPVTVIWSFDSERFIQTVMMMRRLLRLEGDTDAT